MINAIIILVVVGLLGFLYAQVKKYGNGSLLRGLPRYFDPNYELPEVEAARIQTALSDLYGHIQREHGKGWKLTVCVPRDSSPYILVERGIIVDIVDETNPRETLWSGGDPNKPEDAELEIEAFLIETVLEPRQKED